MTNVFGAASSSRLRLKSISARTFRRVRCLPRSFRPSSIVVMLGFDNCAPRSLSVQAPQRAQRISQRHSFIARSTDSPNAGIVELEPTPGGTLLHRMPGWARAQHNDIALSLIETMPSGGRLEMVTDATCIEVDVQLTLLQVGPEPGPPATFELLVDGGAGALSQRSLLVLRGSAGDSVA